MSLNHIPYWVKEVQSDIHMAHFGGNLHISRITGLIDRNRWLNEWVQRDISDPYLPFDQVKENGYLSIANQETTEHASPQDIGLPVNLYNGLSPTVTPTAKNVISGVTVADNLNAYKINAYSVYTIAGNNYRTYSVSELGVVTELHNFKATSTAWQNFPIKEIIVPPDTDFSVLQQVSQPDPAPITWVGNWNYYSPNNDTAPLSGQVTQADKLKNVIRISKTDSDGGNRAVELLAIDIGDMINAGGISWSVSSIVDSGTYVSYTIAPQTQIVDGLHSFEFETVESVPITVLADTDYWLTNQQPSGIIKGLYSIDGGDTVITDSAYGINITIQAIEQSTHWDIQSSPDGGSSSINNLLPLDNTWTGLNVFEQEVTAPNFRTVGSDEGQSGSGGSSVETAVLSGTTTIALTLTQSDGLPNVVSNIFTLPINHTHSNKTILDQFGEDGSGYPTYNGNKIDTVIAQRDVYDGLDSVDNTISLSANNGKVLNDKFGSYLPLTGGTLTGALSGTSAEFSGMIKSTNGVVESRYNDGSGFSGFWSNAAGSGIQVVDPSGTQQIRLATYNQSFINYALNLGGHLNGTSATFSGNGAFGGAIESGIALKVHGKGGFTDDINLTNSTQNTAYGKISSINSSTNNNGNAGIEFRRGEYSSMADFMMYGTANGGARVDLIHGSSTISGVGILGDAESGIALKVHGIAKATNFVTS